VTFSENVVGATPREQPFWLLEEVAERLVYPLSKPIRLQSKHTRDEGAM
jgi:hypothetical protein